MTWMRNGEPGHVHAVSVRLDERAADILRRGLRELLRRCGETAFSAPPVGRFPLPIAQALYGRSPDPARLQADVESKIPSDPISALEPALALLERIVTGSPAGALAIPGDSEFLSVAFNSKRQNGWAAILGNADPKEAARALAGRWRFRIVEGPDSAASLYALLNMLCRYGFVYGRIPPGDGHAMTHFIEDVTPGVLLCLGALSDLEAALVLAAMKMGVPAVVPPGFPFPLGRRAEAGALEDAVEAVSAFPNIRRLLDFPGLPALPEWIEPEKTGAAEAPAPAAGPWMEGWCILRKADVPAPGRVETDGTPAKAFGIEISAQAEPLDAFDRDYIEARALSILPRVRGLWTRREGDRLALALGPGTPPERIGEALIAAIRREFPRIDRLSVRLLFDPARLPAATEAATAERARRRADIESATEESADSFVTCVGCSAFAPDHACILTPERAPQCGRPFALIKTGALYGWDDMTNIHHRAIHAGMNSFGTAPKGACLDPVGGEWSGANDAVSRLTGGRTRRVRLHDLDAFPHTGCGCFQFILFRTEKPRKGIGVMERKYRGAAPDGRTWEDLHYALAGKQAPGLAGAAGGYLRSRKFLRAHGGASSIVWASPKAAALLGAALKPGVEIGPA